MHLNEPANLQLETIFVLGTLFNFEADRFCVIVHLSKIPRMHIKLAMRGQNELFTTTNLSASENDFCISYPKLLRLRIE